MRSILKAAIYRKHKECNGIKRILQLHLQRVQWNVLYTSADFRMECAQNVNKPHIQIRLNVLFTKCKKIEMLKN
jgi:hypothetical protein